MYFQPKINQKIPHHLWVPCVLSLPYRLQHELSESVCQSLHHRGIYRRQTKLDTRVAIVILGSESIHCGAFRIAIMLKTLTFKMCSCWSLGEIEQDIHQTCELFLWLCTREPIPGFRLPFGPIDPTGPTSPLSPIDRNMQGKCKYMFCARTFML